MKKLLISLALMFSTVFSATAADLLYQTDNGVYVYDSLISCYPPQANADYVRRFEREIEKCERLTKEVTDNARWYKRKYNKCKKTRNKTQKWCLDYKSKYQYYENYFKTF